MRFLMWVLFTLSDLLYHLLSSPFQSVMRRRNGKKGFCFREQPNSVPISCSNSSRMNTEIGQKSGLKIGDILQQPVDSCSFTSTSTTENSNEIIDVEPNEKRKGSNLPPLHSSSFVSFNPSISRSSLKWVVPQCLVSMKKKRHVSGREKGGEGHGLGRWAKALIGRRLRVDREKDDEVLDPSFSSLGSMDEMNSPHNGGADLANDDGQKKFPSLGGEKGSNDLDGSSFNLGVGVGLIFLFAKTVNEFNKVTELRNEMESVLKENIMQSKDGVSKSAESTNIRTLNASAASSSDKISFLYTCLPGHKPCQHSPVVGDGDSNCFTELRNNVRPLRMDRLEAELESELERLQYNIEVQNSSARSGNEVEMCDDVEDECSSEHVNQEEDADINGHRDEWDANCGVCPYELERRLHELLEERQQGHIAELEYALHHAQRELQKKEMEIHWLRNSSRLLHSLSSRSC